MWKQHFLNQADITPLSTYTYQQANWNTEIVKIPGKLLERKMYVNKFCQNPDYKMRKSATLRRIRPPRMKKARIQTNIRIKLIKNARIRHTNLKQKCSG